MTYHYTIALLGGLRVVCRNGPVTRFRTQRTGALLAYLAYYLDRQHAREELVDLFWPDADLESGRMSLRTSLSSLRRQLEPPGIDAGSILIADRAYVRLNTAAVSTDVQAMESAAAAAERTDDLTERITFIEKAVALYRGPLLPGVYDDWAVRERERLQMRHHAILLQLAAALEQAGEYRRAVEYAHRAVTQDPLDEEAHCSLMRLFACTGQGAAVTRQYRELARVLRRELKAEPGAATQELYARLTSGGGAQTGSPLTEPTFAIAQPAPTRVERATERHAGTAIPRGATARLPIYLAPFFGREQEKARIVDLLRRKGARLVTVTGAGGSGKTRLAVEVARALAEEFEGAVWFVPLAEIGDAALILDTVIRVLDLSPSPGRASLDLLEDALGYRRSLLVLDNYEQLAEEGALAVRDLLHHISTLSCLVTSRQRLELDGERDYPLAPLPVPDMPGAPEWLARYASVQLFVDRAQAVHPDFQLTAENAPAVAALCERLEGIPLALELAAAWSQILTPSRMLARLSEGADLLTSRRRDVSPRHRTLRATFEWSYRLLPPDLQRLFARLSVFRGGWTLEAADRVCSDLAPTGQPVLIEDTLEQIRALESRSLVQAQEAGEEMRFRMLEALREFADDQLTPEDRRIAEMGQTSYFLALAEQAEGAMDGAEQAAWMERLDREHENSRVVLGRAQSSGDVETGLRLSCALARYWQASGTGDEGIRWLQGLLANSAVVAPRLRARALCDLGELLQSRRLDRTVMELLEESLRIYTELDDHKAMATLLRKISSGIQEITRDRVAAVPLLERSLALCKGVGDMRGIAESLRCLGSTLRDQGDHATAEAYYNESLPLYRQIGDFHGVAAISAEMGYMLHAQKQYDRAETLLQEDLDISRRLGNQLSTGHALWLLGRLAQDRGDSERAACLLDEGLALARQTDNRQQTINCLVNLGLLSCQQGDHRTARRKYAEALALTREMGSRSGLVFPLRLDGYAAIECGDYRAAQDRFRECLTLVRVRDAPRTTIECLEGLARTCQAEGKAEQAARLCGAADAARRADPEIRQSGSPPEQARITEAVRGCLGDTAFEQIWNEGQALSLDQAVEEALLAE